MDPSCKDLTKEEIVNTLKLNLTKNQEIGSSAENVSPRIICFYAEKGGVGKTSTCLALAHVYAADGKRVVVYDCDVQRSLTAWAFGINIECNHSSSPNKVDDFIKSLPVPAGMCRTLCEQVMDRKADSVNSLKPAFAGCVSHNVYIVAGDRSIPAMDRHVLETEISCSRVPTIRNSISARPYHAIMKTAEHYKADYVFLDLNPYPSVLNRCLIMSSHYLIIPLCLDSFCLEMIHMMERNLKNWKVEIDSIESSIADSMPWPSHYVKFLGYIENGFNKYKDNLMRNNEVFMSREILSEAKILTKKLGDDLVIANRLAISNARYRAEEINQCIGNISQYHGLKEMSDLFRVPVPFLTVDHLWKFDKNSGFFKLITGDQRKTYEQNIVNFKNAFNKIKTNIEKLIKNDLAQTERRKRARLIK